MVLQELQAGVDTLGAPQKPRILALHGARSNNQVTQMQLENLKITSENYDIVYHQGPIQVEEGDPELEGIILGPFYSWLDDTDREKEETSLLFAVRDMLSVVADYGPFDGI
jgi:hypothetical protein